MAFVKKYVTYEDGGKVAVWFDLDERVMEFAGKPGALAIPENGDRSDYRYSNGGCLYKAAVEVFWKMEDLRKAEEAA